MGDPHIDLPLYYKCPTLDREGCFWFDNLEGRRSTGVLCLAA